MNIESHHVDRCAMMRLEGELTADQVDRFTTAVAAQLDQRACDFILDLSDLTYIDSRGLEALLRLAAQAHERLGQVRLAGPSDYVRQILRLTRLDQQLWCDADPDTARRNLGAVAAGD